MRAYYYDNLPGDQRLPHDYIFSRPVLDETLEALGVKYWSIPVDNYQAKLDAIANERGYKYRDVMKVSKQGLGDDYEKRLKEFFQEHMHDEDEIRYILSGSGFVDVREAPTNAWIRIAVVPGDLLVYPAGIYHRFSLDEGDNMVALRLSQDVPDWKARNRSMETDKNAIRIRYLQSVQNVTGARWGNTAATL